METDQLKLLQSVSAFLKKNRIPYMITGAWSAIFYGRPRASHDIDFVVELNASDIEKVTRAFNTLSDEFLIQIEGIKEAIKTKNIFQIIHLPTMLKLDFWLLTDEEFDQSRFKRRKMVEILGQLIEMASPEDTIIQKLRWYDQGKIEKHLVDAAFVYQIQKKNLDSRYLNLWVGKLGLKKYLQDLKRIDLEEYL